jgi:RNA polymerase sigma-70 factor (ECF subfamily)
MPPEGDELEMIRHARDGDAAAFALLVGRYAKPVLNFSLRIIGDATEAEDVAQDTFVRAWQHLKGFHEERAAFSTWLFQIARNASLDRLRTRQRKPSGSLDDLTKEPASTQAAPDEAARRSELGRAIACAVAMLPEDQRTAFVLAEYHGQSMREIAVVMDCTEKSVEGRLSRARQFLREKLKPWGKSSET